MTLNLASRSSEVVDFCTNRKRVYDFLLDLNSNLGPILPRFRDIRAFVCRKLLFRYPSPISAKISGCSPRSRSVMLGSAESEHQANWRGNYLRRIRTYVVTIPQRYGRTEGETDGRLAVAILRGKNKKLSTRSPIQVLENSLRRKNQFTLWTGCAEREVFKLRVKNEGVSDGYWQWWRRMWWGDVLRNSEWSVSEKWLAWKTEWSSLETTGAQDNYLAGDNVNFCDLSRR